MLATLPEEAEIVQDIADDPMEFAQDDTLALLQMEEDDLLRRAQDGDEAAFGVIMVKLDGPVRRFVRRLIGSHDAEDDIVQDVFIALYRNLDSVDATRGLKPYVFRSVRNRSYDELRKQGRYQVYSLDADSTETYATFDTLADSHEGPEEVAHWLMIQLEVREAMDRLPENQRQALILFAEEGLSYAEIAEAMNTSVGTIKSRLFHAKKTLRRLVRPDVLEALDAEFVA
jgi:RNA polymerase sigma-70 factor (ECF subfamily)